MERRFKPSMTSLLSRPYNESMSHNVLVDKHERIATVTLNRPDQRNAISYPMWQELAGAFWELEEDRGVRVVVVTGAGDEAFSAGADIKDFQEHRSNPQAAGEYTLALEGTLKALESLSKPAISRINGFCVGGGCELALSTDLRIAAEGSKFGIPVARLGITAGYHESQRLVQVVGAANAAYILLTADLLNSTEALRLGLVHQVIPSHQLDDRVAALASRLSHLAPASHRIHKRILRTLAQGRALDDLTEEERNLPLSVFSTKDFQEGVRAFREKQRPNFQGN